jgi:hypothetical protein
LAPQSQEMTARSIDMSSVERIQRGQQTNRFIAARYVAPVFAISLVCTCVVAHPQPTRSMDKLPSRSEGSADDEGNCLSIIYRVSTREAASFTEGLGAPKVLGPHRFDTLDLLVPNDEDYETLVNTLEALVALYQEERTTFDQFSLFLQYHWIDFGKELDSRLSSSEWIILCDKANIPMKKSLLVSYYKEFCEDRGVEEEGLFLTETAELLAEVRDAVLDVADGEKDPLTKIWDLLVDTDPVPPLKYEGDQADLELELNPQEDTISAVALLSFLRSQQKEFTTSLENVHDLVSLLNSQKLLEVKDKLKDDSRANHIAPAERISKSRFLSYLLSDVNDILDPETGKIGADDMEQPLTNYWINTSHDTFLAKMPNSFRFKDMDFDGYNTVDAQAYVNALYRGVRCLELDVYDGLFGGPVVARRTPTTSSDNQSITFSQVLKSIRSFLRSNPQSYPIILFIETHCSLPNQALMAKDLKQIFANEGMLYQPPQEILNNESRPIPSPHALRGKVIVKNKRPISIKNGATVQNDDFDEENDLPEERDTETVETENWNDEEEDEDERGVVVRFEAAGPIRSADPDEIRRSPELLLETACQEALEAKQEAVRAAAKEQGLKAEAAAAEAIAQSLIERSGMTVAQVESRALQENKVANGEEDGDRNLVPREKSTEACDEGMEVQDFFVHAVDGARSGHSEADAHATSASNVAAQALERLGEAEHALSEAESNLEESYRMEKEKAQDAKKGANDVRSNREHAEIARRRVETVKGLLRNSKDSASSAETVVVTAMTEAKISEQRASETEARASRGLAMGEKERIRADTETRKEEILEQEASNLHDLALAVTKEANNTRERMEKAASMLDRVNEQIKLIERSSQFQKEFKEHDRWANGESYLNEGPRHGGNFVAKHAAKLQERDICTEQMKEVAVANQSAEVRRKRVQTALEEKAHIWKMQSEIASQARKQADRSSQHAEELAEHAEEEREAASLRHIAREKAQKSVTNSDDYQSSIQAQLIEAARASEESASLALESRIRADKLAREAEFAKDHTEAHKHVANMTSRTREANTAYLAALEKKSEADSKATDAKRLMDTSSEVFSNAKKAAATEINNANAKRQVEREAVQAFRKALIAKNLVESSALQARVGTEAAMEKIAAESRALEYKFKMDMRSPISSDLSRLTLLHSTKFKNWEKSISLPNSYMHSIAETRVSQMLENDEEHQRNHFGEFTEGHFIRTFPSWRLVRQSKQTNYNPVVAHGLGCQLVSMNFHSSDEHLLLNEGLFRANGSCGYVLKPAELSFGVERSEKWRFTILCGTCLPKGERAMVRKSMSVGGIQYISPFVRVSLYQGSEQDAKNPILHDTAPSNKNGLNPVWNNADAFEVDVKKPSVALLMFTVWDSEAGDFIAGSTLPVSCLRPGYRSVALFDSLHSRSGPYAYASLFVRAQKTG